MSPEVLRAVLSLASGQRGAVHATQLADLGVSRQSADHMVASGRWQKLHRQTYVVTTGYVLGRTRASAGLLFAGSGSALARTSASHLWGLGPWTMPIRVVRREPMRRSPPGLIVHWTRNLPETDVTTHRGFRTTTPRRTLLDLADELGPVDLADALARAVRRKLVTPAALQADLDRHPRDPFTRLLRTYLDLDGTSLAGVETVLAEALTRAGLRVRLNPPTRMRDGSRRSPDITCLDVPLVLQIDSRAFHRADANGPDMKRDLDWLLQGSTTLRIEAWRVRGELRLVVAEVLAAADALGRRSA